MTARDAAEAGLPPAEVQALALVEIAESLRLVCEFLFNEVTWALRKPAR